MCMKNISVAADVIETQPLYTEASNGHRIHHHIEAELDQREQQEQLPATLLDDSLTSCDQPLDAWLAPTDTAVHNDDQESEHEPIQQQEQVPAMVFVAEQASNPKDTALYNRNEESGLINVT